MAEPHRIRPGGIERPLSERLSPSGESFAEVMRRHDEAVAAGRVLYRDPATGLSVFTSVFLADRGYCCGSGCRHCPYEPAIG